MLKRHKEHLRALVGELRRTLAGSTDVNGNKIRGDLDRELERLGIAENGKVTPVDALVNPTAQERRANLVAAAELNRGTSREEIVERAAYTWINRLLALRAMEARGLVDETLRANPDYEGLSEALFVLRQTEPGRTTGADAGWWAVLETACTIQAEALPGLFDLADPAAALRPTTQALLKCIKLVGGQQPGFTLEESDAAFADPDAIGWAYQFYQEAKKTETYIKLGKGGKASTRAEIAAVTQLFTEPYMVQWLLQNSLGRSYHELYPDSQLPARWAYYIKPEKLDPPAPAGLATLTLMDPCVGSGHFLREAFDMFAAMCREQQPGLKAAQIADNIFERHLHGIDLDPRAVQLAAFTLYLRAWELVRDERRRERQPGPGTYRPGHINLATTPTGLSQGSLDRHLQRHPEDRLFKPILQGIFESLEQAEILGSLLRPGEHLDKAIAAMQGTYNIPLDLDPADAALRRSIMEMAKHNPAELRWMLMDRIAASFQAEAQSTIDIASSLFGRAASEGIRLLQLLDQKYAVVVTNPPYMGSANMDEPLRKFVEKYYKPGKVDLYGAFILRCLLLCLPKGRLGMVTMQSWMFAKSFTELRAIQEEEKSNLLIRDNFKGLLIESSIENLAHLGTNAFEEISGEVVQTVMFTISNKRPKNEHYLNAMRLVGFKTSQAKADILRSKLQRTNSNVFLTAKTSTFLEIPQAPIIYWLLPNLAQLLAKQPPIGRGSKGLLTIRDGMNTGDNLRFVRFYWEVNSKIWRKYSKGGGYGKWSGFEQYVVKWGRQGELIENANLPGTRFQNTDTFFTPALCYSLMAQGALGVRFSENTAYDGAGLSVQPLNNTNRNLIAGLLNCRFISYLARLLAQDIKFRGGYVERVPQPLNLYNLFDYYIPIILKLKLFEIAFAICEMAFIPSVAASNNEAEH